MPAVSTHPVWFGPAGRPRFGQLHLPVGGEARGGVVICPPLGYEYTCSHRTMRSLAESLAARGLAAFRFDYDGIGDSAGAITDPDRLDAWIQSVVDAIDWLAAAAVPVAAVGMRLGATLALEATRRRRVSSLVLWDPVPSGHTWVRELRTFGSVSSVAGGGGESESGSLDASTLLLDRATLEALEGFAPDGSGQSGQILALTRPDRSSRRLRKVVGDGEQVTWWEAEDQSTLLDGDSLEARVPQRTLAAVVDWLADRFPKVEVPIGVPEVAEVRLVGTDPEITERAVSIGPHGLFGILAEADAVAGRPLVVCLNNSVDHHVGPGRLWVDCGRALAGRGFRVLRLDLSGLGDSPAQPDEGVDRPYPLRAAEDLAAVTAFGGEDGVVLVGLCSGGRLAIEAADVVCPRGVVAINPSLLIPLAVLQQAAPEFPNPPAIIKYNRDHRIRRRLNALLPNGIWRLRTVIRRGPAAPRQLQDLLASGVDVFLLYGEDDFGLWKARQTLGWMFRRFARHPNFELATLPGLDHGLIGTQARNEVSAAVTEHLVARFGGEPGAEIGAEGRRRVQAESGRRQ